MYAAYPIIICFSRARSRKYTYADERLRERYNVGSIAISEVCLLEGGPRHVTFEDNYSAPPRAAKYFVIRGLPAYPKSHSRLQAHAAYRLSSRSPASRARKEAHTSTFHFVQISTASRAAEFFTANKKKHADQS